MHLFSSPILKYNPNQKRNIAIKELFFNCYCCCCCYWENCLQYVFHFIDYKTWLLIQRGKTNTHSSNSGLFPGCKMIKLSRLRRISNTFEICLFYISAYSSIELSSITILILYMNFCVSSNNTSMKLIVYFVVRHLVHHFCFDVSQFLYSLSVFSSPFQNVPSSSKYSVFSKMSVIHFPLRWIIQLVGFF